MLLNASFISCLNVHQAELGEAVVTLSTLTQWQRLGDWMRLWLLYWPSH